MKKIFYILLLFLTIFTVGCGTPEEGKVSIATPKGVPFMIVGTLIDNENYAVTPVNGVLGVKQMLLDNEQDIIIAPINIGVQLYTNKNSKYVLDSVIALGNNYIVSKKDKPLSSLNDLNGKTLLAFGKTGTPGTILTKVLETNNIDCKVDYLNALTDVVPFFMQNKYDYILASEPIISNLIVTKKLELNIIDLQDYIDVTIMQAGIFVKTDSTRPNMIKKAIKDIKNNINDMKNNTESYVDTLITKDVYFSDLTKDTLMKCITNLSFDYLKASKNIENIEKYLDLINYEKPTEEFYK